jgi:hypothetical protein
MSVRPREPVVHALSSLLISAPGVCRSDPTPRAIAGKMKIAPHALILSDKSHISFALSDCSIPHHRRYLFFAERPATHIYPGARIGASYR